MLAVIILGGVVGGLSGFGLALISGFSLLAALAIYPLAGFFCAAICATLVSLCPVRRETCDAAEDDLGVFSA